jgi:LacI family transcriptional regulator
MAEAVEPRRRILVGFRLVEALVDLLQGLNSYAKQHDRKWQFRCVDSDEFWSLCTPALADGAITVIGPGERNLPSVRRRSRVPMVNLLHDLSPQTVSVLSDDHALGRMGAQYLIRCGFRQFAFLGFKARWSRDRERGFVEAVTASGNVCHISNPSLRNADHRLLHTKTAARAVRQWILGLPRPVAIMVCSDRIARMALDVCEDAGVRVPEEAAILGVDNLIPTCELAPVPLSSVAQDFPRLGFVAARMLDRLISGGKKPAQAVLVPPAKVVVRHSTDVLVFKDEYISLAMQLIHQKAATGISMKELMRHVPVSRKWLDTRFKVFVGHTPSDEIRRLRLEQIRDLLLNTELSVRQIAGRCGFSRAENLIRFFRDGYGMPPQKYRASADRQSPQ